MGVFTATYPLHLLHSCPSPSPPPPLSLSCLSHPLTNPHRPALPLRPSFPPRLHSSRSKSNRRRHRHCSSSSPSSACQSHGPQYEFRDEGPDVELRVQLPSQITGDGLANAANIMVDAQDISLTIVLRTPTTYQNIFSAPRLYGRIKPSQTVWYVDEDSVVLSMKKADEEIAWPGLLEAWEALILGVSKLLKGTSIYIIGESTDINWAVARELAAGLEYVPLQTCRLLEQLTRKSLNELLAVEGADYVAESEAMILSSLNTHVRVVVATLGGSHGAASRDAKWKQLHAGFTVWLSQSTATDEYSAKEEAFKAKDEGSQAYANADVIVAVAGWNNSARAAAEGCLKALKYLVESQKDLPDKKMLYVRLGCRGDWPNIMPPGWDPNGEETTTAKVLAL